MIKLEDTFKALESQNIISTSIQQDIQNSLKHTLRDYQTPAIKRFMHYVEKYTKQGLENNHVAFEMATGSGKTLTMAALILYLYKQGYNKFIFFVNQVDIIEKTKENFINTLSNKYLFNNPIQLNNKRVNIKEIATLEEASDNDINIMFTTINALHNNLRNVKENSITIEDFAKHKIVLLADEAHHNSGNTKKSSDSSWEDTVEKLFNCNKKNYLLEFSATFNFTNTDVINKYNSKIIYKYSLKMFSQQGYAKKINQVVNHENIENRMLIAVLTNIFKEKLFASINYNVKPVILFKSSKIDESKENTQKFITIINNLQHKDIEEIFKQNINIEVVKEMQKYFAENNITSSNLVDLIKLYFIKDNIINVNEGDASTKDFKKEQQHLDSMRKIHTLEDKNNNIRAIFVVAKLIEGWDVLNLFDIVKLYATKTDKETTQEAQLIGRGARYYPFILNNEEENKFKRKYDNTNTPFRYLETLHYHTTDTAEFVEKLNKSITKSGLEIVEDNRTSIEIKIKEEFKKTDLFKNGEIYINKKLQKKDLPSDQINIIPDSKYIVVEYTVDNFKAEVSVDNNNYTNNTDNVGLNYISLKEIGFTIFYKAINQHSFFYLCSIKEHGFSFTSIKDLFNKYIDWKAEINIPKNYTLQPTDKLYICIEFLNKLEDKLKYNYSEYRGSEDFTSHKISEVFTDKTVFINKEDAENIKADNSKIFMQTNLAKINNLEKELIKKIEDCFNNDNNYKEVYLFRNEKHFKLYNFDDGVGFEPDFVLFLKNNDNNFINYQIFIEPKGDMLIEHDKWKEDFLKKIEIKMEAQTQKIHITKLNQKVFGMPFFTESNKEEFTEKLKEKVKNYKA